MTYIEVAYIGLFVLPLTLAAVPALRSLHLPRPRGGRIFLGLWVTIVVAGGLIFAGRDHFMPYIGQYVGLWGIGPTDLRGGRPLLVDPDVRYVLTVLALLSTVLFALFLAARLFARTAPDRSSASLVTMIGVWQVLGVLPPSFHFRNWIISVDRYLLPLVPIAIVLLLWALRQVSLVRPVAWLGVALYAAFAITGTRDFLVFQQATWDMASEAVAMGVPLTQLDGGASWDGYYLYEYSVDQGIRQQTPSGPWWTNLFGPATTSEYVVSTAPLRGHLVVRAATYSSWLTGESHQILLLHRIVPPPVR